MSIEQIPEILERDANVSRIETDPFFDSTKKLIEALDFQLDDFGIECDQRRVIDEALRLSIALHIDQTRDSGQPYLNHVLRVTLTTVLKFRVTDPDVIAAALLHDFVEDQDEEVVARLGEGKSKSSRNRALAVVRAQTSKSTTTIVDRLSKRSRKFIGEFSEAEIEERKIWHYRDYVIDAVKDPNVALIKLADLMDNAFGVKKIADTERRRWLSRKYVPVLRHMKERIRDKDIPLSESEKLGIAVSIGTVILDLEKFLE